MDTDECLIICNGKNKTNEIKSCLYNPQTNKYDIIFNNSKSEKVYSYDRKSIKIIHSGLKEAGAKHCMSYLQELSTINELKSEEGEVLLQKQYEKLGFVDAETVMPIYLYPDKYKISTYNKPDLIFPFGGNASQFKAVEKALTNQMSVIQGPPGTGKTQTILNIIANLLIKGKTMQIVSNNNSAIENVLEKLASPKYHMEFIVALLGNSNNKKAFLKNQTGQYPDLSEWQIYNDVQEKIIKNIKSLAEEMTQIFEQQEKLVKLQHELNSLKLEIKYFNQYCHETGLTCTDIKTRYTLKSETLMKLWQKCDRFAEKDRGVSFWFKIKSVFIYGIATWKFYKKNIANVITLFQTLFYTTKQSELSISITRLEKNLAAVDAKKKMNKLTDLSLTYLKAKLFEKYYNKPEPKRKIFTDENLWKTSEDIIKEYPVILSTTFSSRSALKGVTYDYLIMDESSQVDIATGALALSCAKNAVIVGDLKQLPNVITNDIKKRSDIILEKYHLPDGYSFSNSFLKSICTLFPKISRTLLKEHYRCHPKIIGFCNQKFYNNELIIMTQDHGEKDVLSVYQTVVGNHQRAHINQRQIDVIMREALPSLKNDNLNDVGIIAPYRDQVSTITKELVKDEIEVHTVHKFQGREKDTIILTTVDNVITNFSDDPYLLNVAISRAKNKFCLVTSGNDQPLNSNIGDLLAYIKYNNFQIIKSEIYSIFDLLYQQYTAARLAFLRKHLTVSKYDSENIMYGKIVDILKNRSHLSLAVSCHHPLNMLIRNTERLNEKERHYVANIWSHVDFLIYSTIRKDPVFAIEVDGFHYHKAGTLQYERDRMKDHILNIYNIPLLRFATNGSNEIEKIEQQLDEYVGTVN